MRRLADYVIQRHDRALIDRDDRYLELLRAVAERQAALIARWMGVGFIHGVMNTDNMTISGETIDYGPCAFMEAYDPRAVFSSIDTHGRYAYANQPGIAQWNLARFAETLLPLLDASTDRALDLASAVIQDFPARYRAHWLAVMRAKLGIDADDPGDGSDDDADLALGEAFLRPAADPSRGLHTGLARARRCGRRRRCAAAGLVRRRGRGDGRLAGALARPSRG